jgi:hypothetical protein
MPKFGRIHSLQAKKIENYSLSNEWPGMTYLRAGGHGGKDAEAPAMRRLVDLFPAERRR